MGDILYHIVVLPVEYLLGVIYVLLFRFLEHPGYAIIGVSIVVNFLILPLYLRADSLQEEESERQKNMKFWTDHIRKFFRSDERYMIQSAYYRTQQYRPIYALRGVLSLFLQIPFFIAAYHFLSHTELLNGVSLGPIADLSSPDGIFSFLGHPINVLPVLMTVVNIISGMIYTKGKTGREKLQVILPAFVFLVLLYQSPSGLVVYWTMNNIFSMGKNIVVKYVKDKKRFLSVIFTLFGILYWIFIFVSDKINKALAATDNEAVAIYIVIGLLLFIPNVCVLLNGRYKINPRIGKSSTSYFMLISSASVILMGGVIPLAVVAASPQEFINKFYYVHPLFFIAMTFFTYIGFALWIFMIYRMIGKDKREIIELALTCGLMVFLFNYFTCSADVGVYNSVLMFEHEPHYAAVIRYGNVLIDAIICLVIVFIMPRFEKLFKSAALVILGVLVVMSCRYIYITLDDIKWFDDSGQFENEKVDFPLSKNGRNVIVIMMDRMMGAYVPFILDERPELVEKFDGFTYYPNAISTGMVTYTGSPALFGGYEYTAYAINERTDETLLDKHSEAISLMPVMFGKEGWNVTVCDLPYAGLKQGSDYSLYDKYDYVNAFHYYDRFENGGDAEETHSLMERNFVFHSMYKVAPAMLQDNIYDYGNYLSGRNFWYGDAKEDFYALKALKDNTSIVDGPDQLIIYVNLLTHDPCILQLPDYTVVDHLDNSSYDFETVRTLNGTTMNLENGLDGIEHYFVNASAMIQLGEYFDYLREEGVYDNTRIILTADHGFSLNQFSEMKLDNGIDVQGVDAILMVKDYDAEGFIINEEFMTNADVPALAAKDNIEHPINPFTGNTIDMFAKEDGVYISLYDDFEIGGYGFLRDNPKIYRVKENAFKSENWIKVE